MMVFIGRTAAAETGWSPGCACWVGFERRSVLGWQHAVCIAAACWALASSAVTRPRLCGFWGWPCLGDPAWTRVAHACGAQVGPCLATLLGELPAAHDAIGVSGLCARPSAAESEDAGAVGIPPVRLDEVTSNAAGTLHCSPFCPGRRRRCRPGEQATVAAAQGLEPGSPIPASARSGR